MKTKTLQVRNAKKKFEAFEEKAGKLGFGRVSHKRETRDLKIQKVIPPKSDRLIGLKNQVILEKQVDNYTIRVVTTYDPATKSFSVNGKLWVRIVTPDPKTGREPGVFTWKTTRTGDFLGRAFLMMSFLDCVLENRSIDSQGKLLTVESRVGVYEHHPYIWVGNTHTGEKVEIKSFMLPHPRPDVKSWGKVLKFIQKWARDLWYYETKRRHVRGYKLRERDIRKKYTVKKRGK